MLVRLQKIISDRGYCSRRKAEDLMQKGLVLVDGKPVTELGSKFEEDTVLVTVEGKERRDAVIRSVVALPRAVAGNVERSQRIGKVHQTRYLLGGEPPQLLDQHRGAVDELRRVPRRYGRGRREIEHFGGRDHQ